MCSVLRFFDVGLKLKSLLRHVYRKSEWKISVLLLSGTFKMPVKVFGSALKNILNACFEKTWTLKNRPASMDLRHGGGVLAVFFSEQDGGVHLENDKRPIVRKPPVFKVKEYG